MVNIYFTHHAIPLSAKYRTFGRLHRCPQHRIEMTQTVIRLEEQKEVRGHVSEHQEDLFEVLTGIGLEEHGLGGFVL